MTTAGKPTGVPCDRLHCPGMFREYQDGVRCPECGRTIEEAARETKADKLIIAILLLRKQDVRH